MPPSCAGDVGAAQRQRKATFRSASRPQIEPASDCVSVPRYGQMSSPWTSSVIGRARGVSATSHGVNLNDGRSQHLANMPIALAADLRLIQRPALHVPGGNNSPR